MSDRVVYLPDIVGCGYRDFWNYTGRYRVLKGSRASKKSTTTAMNLICRIMEHEDANALVVRKTYRTLKDSCFNQLKWAIYRLGVEKYWRATVAPLELIYKPTGQKIVFRGLDDPLKVTSVTVDRGVLCFLWIEEAYEITKEEDFDMLNESIRGEMPAGLFKQVTLTFNPWNEKHWIKKRFFDVQDDDIMAITTNYMCNEWLDEADRKVFNDMRRNNPRRYQVAGLGDWGIVDGLVYENWREDRFNLEDIKKIKGIQSAFGLDYGYTQDPSALFCGMVDNAGKRIFVFDEMYRRGMSNRAIANEIKRKGYEKERIRADREIKSIDEMRTLGIERIVPADKGPDSINHGIQFIQDFEIIIHPSCVNFITEIGNYQWDKDRLGNTINKPVDDFNHLLDAMRYALEPFSKNRRIRSMDKTVLGL